MEDWQKTKLTELFKNKENYLLLSQFIKETISKEIPMNSGREAFDKMYGLVIAQGKGEARDEILRVMTELHNHKPESPSDDGQST